MRKESGSTSASERGNQAIEQTQLSMQWKLRKGEQVARYSESGMLSVLASVAAIARERHNHRISPGTMSSSSSYFSFLSTCHLASILYPWVVAAPRYHPTLRFHRFFTFVRSPGFVFPFIKSLPSLRIAPAISLSRPGSTKGIPSVGLLYPLKRFSVL